MAKKYYSQRKKPLSEILSDDFWNAWLYTMKEFAKKNYLCESFGWDCECGCKEKYNIEKIQEKIYCEIGNLKFEAFETNILSQDEKLDLIQFFFNFISKPTDKYFECRHYMDVTRHPVSFDKGKGTYEYTIEINRLFENFNHPYRLVKGQIRLTTSPILDIPILSLELETDDTHLKKLIDTAVSNFYDRSGSKKQIALQNIVHSFERLKTLEDDDKKKSVKKVLEKISIIDSVKSSLDEDMQELTNIANNFCIRHHEKGKKEINDPEIIDFLFYLYFNYIRLILVKYNMVKKNKENNDEDIPFDFLGESV